MDPALLEKAERLESIRMDWRNRMTPPHYLKFGVYWERKRKTRGKPNGLFQTDEWSCGFSVQLRQEEDERVYVVGRADASLQIHLKSVQQELLLKSHERETSRKEVKGQRRSSLTVDITIIPLLPKKCLEKDQEAERLIIILDMLECA
ncbi:hypothetical protein JOB18_027069 [Solea senegalensis]|uniref:Uncharacterized protein n=1 Tax=Solea senegalensis TaxID=28829 RepID=A0AAV6SC32_SOLSE|nr:hypothetical protein JOB18_027069 [Solea senegalensis]